MVRRSDPIQGLSWPGVEFGGDGGEFVGGVNGQVCALWEVLTQQAIGVLVGPALPWAVRVAEEYRYVGGGCEFDVAGHRCALIPGQRPADLGWERLEVQDQGIAYRVCGVCSWEVQQHHEARGPLHESADGRTVVLTGDQSGSPGASLLIDNP